MVQGSSEKGGREGKRKCRQRESPLQSPCLGQGLAEHPLPPSIPAAGGGAAGAPPQLLTHDLAVPGAPGQVTGGTAEPSLRSACYPGASVSPS